MSSTLVDIRELRTYFHTDDGCLKAVDDISLQIAEGHTLGIVGESGSGKSVTSLSIMRLLAPAANIESGEISFLGKDLVRLPEADMRQIRGRDISMIFQEPMTSLNPVYTVGEQVIEAIVTHQQVSKREARKRTIELFDEVGISDPDRRVDSYPHEMSGGQKQRVMIAMALSCNPKLLIADEPTTALDVTIQAQILDILRHLRDARGMSILFITHDLGVIAEIADEVIVMYQGKIVEHGDILDIFQSPQHPYTKGLLACRPRLDTQYKRLPTVEDFMEEKRDNGKMILVEKEMSEERLASFVNAGRPRLLHPKSRLEEIGHTWPSGSDIVPEQTEPLLSVRNLKVYFPIRDGLMSRRQRFVKAVDDVSFDVYRGQTLGLVGESGCGKTTTGRAILKLQKPTSGQVFFQGKDVAQMNSRQFRPLRQKMQIIFQDPFGSMNPRMTIEGMLIEPMKIHRIGSSRKDRRDRAVALLEEVGMSAEHLRRYPHEFSGGQRQRICVARALTLEPEFIICDESVSALDVSVQAQVLNMLNDLQLSRNLTYIFISHDLSVVKFMADMMAVMNDGKLIEFGPSESIYGEPAEEYTRRLIEATPRDTLEHIRERKKSRDVARQQRQAR